VAAERYTLSAKDLLDIRVQLNGSDLKLAADGSLPFLIGLPTHAGHFTIAPATITFLAIPEANNASCR